MANLTLGLVGDGIVGGAFRRWQDTYTKNKVLIYDEPKGIKDSFKGVDCIFICLPAPTLPSRDQDLSLIKLTLRRYENSGVPVFIRSTVLPGTTDRLARLSGLNIYFCPEFLTERIADEDFKKHKIVCGDKKDKSIKPLLAKIFPGKELLTMTNIEAEISKYAHNCFGAIKVSYFNTIYFLCKELGTNYQAVLDGLSVTGFIEKTHTQVPGPDGKFGYGGKCFPKDLRAFIGLLLNEQIPTSYLRRIEAENEILRNVSDGFSFKQKEKLK